MNAVAEGAKAHYNKDFVDWIFTMNFLNQRR